MADRLDVAERLAEGRVAIEHTQAYVRACQTLGYEHPDLTSHPSQIRDWFDSEDGLDLRVLDRDCAQLRAAAAAASEGLRIQQDQVAELVAAWMGVGGDAAVSFLQRHCDAANMVATEMRAAAQRCESLRDNLWHLLDSKVGTVIAIDDRRQAQRSAWLAAAAVVTAGAGERSTAEQVVRGQVMPYVDNDIRNDWLMAMRSSLRAFGTAYDMVNDRMAGAPAVYFDMPGDLGPGYQLPQPSLAQPDQTVPPPAATAPAAALPTVAPDPAPAPVAAAPAATPTPPGADLAPPLSDFGAGLGDAAALPTAGGGLGDVGGGAGGLGGLSGLAGRIVDALGGLLGSATDGLGDSSGLDDPVGKDPFDDDEDPFKPDDEHDDADDEHDKPDEEHDKADAETADAEKADAAKEAEGTQPVNAPPPAGTPPLPVGEPAPADSANPAAAPVAAPAPPPDGATPCEIAADQVPQAGQ